MSIACTAKTLDALPPTSRGKSYFFFQHVRHDTVDALSEFARRGYRIAKVVGLDYSTQPAALERLLQMGIQTEIVRSEDAPATLLRFLADQNLQDGEVLVLDVGGYALDASEHPAMSKLLCGIVEETNNGLWRYESGAPKVPVVQIARCPNKSVENALVGAAIVGGSSKVLGTAGRSLRNEAVSVLGFGGIGEHVCMALQNLGVAVLRVFDPDPQRLMLAIARGYLVTGRAETLTAANVIIGCAGRESVGLSDLPLLRNQPVLFSGSSKQIEFGSLCRCDDFKLGLYGDLLSLTNGEVIIANEGKPINLSFTSLPASFGDFLFANLFSAAAQVLESERAARISVLELDRQKQIAADWLALHH